MGRKEMVFGQVEKAVAKQAKIAGEAAKKAAAAEVKAADQAALARAWGAFSPQTGVTTPIGSPKLELLADQVVQASKRMDVSPEDALLMFIHGNARLGKKKGGEVSVDDFLSNLNKAEY